MLSINISETDEESSNLNIWISDFVKQRRFSKYELELTGHSAKGDGYLGEVTFVKLLTKNGGKDEKTYNLVIKSAKKGDQIRKQTPLKEVFEREMFMYQQIFPAFKAFQLEQKVQDIFQKFAKCYSVSKENHQEAIILQNLKCLGYEVYDRKKPQNLDHVMFVFDCYGKFHALSLGMKLLQPDLYRKLTCKMTDLLAKFVVQAGMVKHVTEGYHKAINLLDHFSVNKLPELDEAAVKNILYKSQHPEDGLSVILHGDCWNNNMMFKYQDTFTTKPKDMVFIDFQLSSLGSPIYDLSYYLYAVADEEVLQHFNSLLATYHHSLMSFLKKLGVDSYQITLEDLKQDWKEFGLFGLVLAPFILKFELSEADEVVDFAECAENGDIADTLSLEIKNKQVFEDRVMAVFKHYASLL